MSIYLFHDTHDILYFILFYVFKNKNKKYIFKMNKILKMYFLFLFLFPILFIYLFLFYTILYYFIYFLFTTFYFISYSAILEGIWDFQTNPRPSFVKFLCLNDTTQKPWNLILVSQFILLLFSFLLWATPCEKMTLTLDCKILTFTTVMSYHYFLLRGSSFRGRKDWQKSKRNGCNLCPRF